MNLSSFKKTWWRSEIKPLLLGEMPFPRPLLLLALGASLLVLWTALAPPSSSREAERCMRRILTAQGILQEWRLRENTASSPEEDPRHSGLIGLEWSPLTTTLGDLEAKQTAADPRWGAVFLNWYRRMGLEEGSRAAILSSGSFPGFLLAALAAAEEMHLEILLLPSLGSSTWGANLPELTLLDMLHLFRKEGVLHTSSKYCSLGGNGDLGGGLSPEGISLLLEAVRRRGIPLLREESLEAMLRRKEEILEAFHPQALISIGGSATSLGNDPEVLRLNAGILKPSSAKNGGNGLIRWGLDHQIPVLHLLHVRELCRQSGIPWNDFSGSLKLPSRIPRWAALTVLGLFGAVLFRHRRWEITEKHSK